MIADDSAATQSIIAASVTAMGVEVADTADLLREPSGSAASRSSESVMRAAVAAVREHRGRVGHSVDCEPACSQHRGGERLERSISCGGDVGHWFDRSRTKGKGEKQSGEHVELGHGGWPALTLAQR